ncbi:NtaA/DmoA family FMN-dependent monooxygenase [Nakamurella leprariae]|uniref:NtaA/DmoA family FMN-dependent monooxygenase n=1 Tax=Nakamurella leprariae TaxID=2803911 RepID=A0A939BYJ9_9ACTN|nr:NtaA/DmoA family FMN-dependent monooxygenase [Nakamurella leprariae]MBM9466706.1 NtaA/DmoA family FMN-dependent monooxygenase [Nakamurella leprariae]
MTHRSRQVHLAAYFPGVNHHTVWRHPDSGSQIEFDSFVEFIRTAERGRFDFFFLAEGLGVREHRGAIVEHSIAGRPDSLTVLPALAAVTEHIGLVATINSTFNDPYQLARQFGSLDVLSGGRAGWNVVTSVGAGDNFSRGRYLDYADRYRRATEVIDASRRLWTSRPDGPTGPGPSVPIDYRGEFVTVDGPFSVPSSPQGHPVIVQAGDSDDGREFAAQLADVVFTPSRDLDGARAFFRDVKSRLPRYGRAGDDLRILPGASFVLGDTSDEARERAAHLEDLAVSGPVAMYLLEQQWGRDLSAYDPDGPLPDVDPDWEVMPARVRTQEDQDPRAVVARWRAIAEHDRLSIRQLMARVRGLSAIVGTPVQVADHIQHWVETEACDGFIITPAVIPSGLAEFVDRVVPILQERGVHRRDYTGTTLREHLDVPVPELRMPVAQGA